MVNMKKFLLIIIFLFQPANQYYCQSSQYKVFDFQKSLKVVHSNIFSGNIEFTLEPSSNTSLKGFVIDFILPDNLKLYKNVLLNGNKTKTSYFQTTHGKILNDRIIQFSYAADITEEKGLLIYFHVIPVLNDSGRIIARFRWVNENGNNQTDSLYTGMIYTQAPTLEKIIVNTTGRDAILKAKLKYSHDYDGYVPENSMYDLQFSNGSNTINITNPSLNIKSGPSTEYTVNGKITYANTTWAVTNQKIVIDGTITGEIVDSTKPPVVASTTNTLTFENSFHFGTGLTNGIFSDYSVSISLMKVKIVDYLLLSPSKISLYHSFKMNNTAITFGQELVIDNPLLEKTKFVIGLESGIILLQSKELFTAFTIGLEYAFDKKMSLQLFYKRHNNSVINSDLFLIFSRSF
jgi:hypothetical protein